MTATQEVRKIAKTELIKVGPENASECGIGCLTDSKNPGYRHKSEWLQGRFAEGLRFLLFRDGEAQDAPSYYGVFSLIWNGRLLSDHYVSKGRFKNLLHKDILKGRDQWRLAGESRDS